MRKKRILMVNDGHHLATGYGTYGKELLSRLQNTGKYEIAELACFSTVEDAKRLKKEGLPWKFYANHVSESDPRINDFKSHPSNAFGKWRFEHVCLDFKPDIVFDIRDPWMLGFVENSPYRKFFHWHIMPTVDSAPQNEAWLETFISADSVFTYSEWGQEVLKEQCGKNIKLCGVGSCGVDTELFKPTRNKKLHKDRFNLDSSCNIVGTVMRNQKRKLYPDLMDAFNKYIDICKEKGEIELAKNTYLYLHTAYPDMGWNIPDLLKKYGLSHKTLFTYICRHCNYYFPSFFKDVKSVCPRCNNLTAMLPNTSFGLTREQLSDVYNLFDVYIQYSTCEGFGVPQIEAISCGLPLFTVDYSAMSEVGEKSGGYKVPIAHKFLELETGAFRVYPDNDYAAQKLYEHFRLPEPIRAKRGFQSRLVAETEYSWDRIAEIWDKHFDTITVNDNTGWDSAGSTHAVPGENVNIEHMSNEEFVRFIAYNVLNDPSFEFSHKALGIIRSLNYGVQLDGNKIVPVDRREIYNRYRAYALSMVYAERLRLKEVPMPKLDFIEAA